MRGRIGYPPYWGHRLAPVGAPVANAAPVEAPKEDPAPPKKFWWYELSEASNAAYANA